MYTTWGRTRSDCGHVHGTIEAAERCVAKDAARCRAAGGYSDRHVREIESKDDLERYFVEKGPGTPVLE